MSSTNDSKTQYLMATTKKHKKVAARKAVRKVKPNLEDFVKAAHAAGAKVSFGLEPTQMPRRFPNDPEPVRMLVEESERISKLGNDWLTAKIPNQIAAEMCLKNGWGYALAAAWLRCKLEGKLLPESQIMETLEKHRRLAAEVRSLLRATPNPEQLWRCDALLREIAGLPPRKETA